MRTAVIVHLTVLIALLARAPLAAQPASVWSLERGDRIRVTERGLVSGSSGSSTVGLFDALAGDTIFLKPETGAPTAFALRDVSRIGVSRGRARATKYGLGVGLAVGVLVGLAAEGAGGGNRGTCDRNTDPRCGLQIGPVTVGQEAVAASVAGLAIGGIIGTLITYESWSDVKFGLSPQGFTLTLTMESRAGNRVRKNSLPSRNMRR